MEHIITFPTTHMALKFEKIIAEQGISGKLVPVPRRLSSNCGLSARLNSREDLEQALSLCNKEGVEYEHGYELPDDKRAEPEIIS